MSNNLPNFLKKRAFLTPDRIALHFEDETLTFHELYERSLEIAERLVTAGFNKETYAGVLLRNHIDTVIILFSFQMIGAKAVMLNGRLSAAELAWQLKDSKASFLITEAAFSAPNEEPILELPSLTVLQKEEIASLGTSDVMIQEEIDLNDICTIMYTSGTTGNPKGVKQTYGNHWWSAVGSALNLGFMESDRWLCAVPLFHISGFSILMRSVIYGMAIVLHEGFNEVKVLEDIDSKKVTIMSAVSTMLTRLTDVLRERRLPEYFRCMLLGGGPAPLPLLEACVEMGIPVFQSYGMTETASQIVTLAPEYSFSKLGSAGKPLFPAQIKIVAKDGKQADPNEAGEIAVKGPNITSGYLNRPEATTEKLRDGWFYTGDIGTLDEEGFLYVLDRRDDLIISGGENIYPAEIESILSGHPAVGEAGVAGVPDEKWGQVPIAYIVAKTGISLKKEDLYEFCTGRMAKYKIPNDFIFIKELPRNAANKLLRRKLREYWSEGRAEI